MSEEFISCRATFVNDDVIELPIGREFLSKPVKARGEWFVTFYFGWHHQVELVKLVDMNDLKDFKDDLDKLQGVREAWPNTLKPQFPRFFLDSNFQFQQLDRQYNVELIREAIQLQSYLQFIFFEQTSTKNINLKPYGVQATVL